LLHKISFTDTEIDKKDVHQMTQKKHQPKKPVLPPPHHLMNALVQYLYTKNGEFGQGEEAAL
jgi:hypothetical protein